MLFAMDKNIYQSCVRILEEELVPAMGCTEPIAVAYAAALARDTLGALPEAVEVAVSDSILKNVKSVIVPNTGGMRGVPAAVAAGIAAGKAEKKLEVLSEVDDAGRRAMAAFLKERPVRVVQSDSGCVFDIGIRVRSGGDEAFVRISGHHTNVVHIERNGDVVRLAAYAPMFGCVNAGYNQWAADMMFYTNTELVLTPNYYVQQLFMRNTGDSVLTTKEKLSSDFVNTAMFGSTEVPALYKVISRDAETGDILVKLVNAGERDIDVNIAVKGASTAGIAHVSTLQCDDINAVNSLTAEAVSPETYTLGIASTFGYTAEGRSVTVIRITTK